MGCGSTVRSERSMIVFGAAGRGPPALKSEADAVEFTCAARGNPRSKMVRSLIEKYIGSDPRQQYMQNMQKGRFPGRSIPTLSPPRPGVYAAFGQPGLPNLRKSGSWQYPILHLVEKDRNGTGCSVGKERLGQSGSQQPLLLGA